MSNVVIENLLKVHITRAEMIKNGFSAQKYDDVCRNRSSYKVDDLIKISEKFQLSLDFLIKGTDTDNVVLTDEEKNLLEVFKKLSSTDKTRISERAETLAELAAERADKERAAEQPKKAAQIAAPAADEQPESEEEEYGQEASDTCVIPYYDYPASAGTGLFLDETIAEDLTIKATPEAFAADFAIPISGDSMETDFSSGDIVLVRSCPNIPEGQIGIFVLDGDVYIKEYGGDCLISHNSKYNPIMLKDYGLSICLGRVLGKAEVIE